MSKNLFDILAEAKNTKKAQNAKPLFRTVRCIVFGVTQKSIKLFWKLENLYETQTMNISLIV
jgi:hypothetical protein